MVMWYFCTICGRVIDEFMQEFTDDEECTCKKCRGNPDKTRRIIDRLLKGGKTKNIHPEIELKQAIEEAMK